MKTKKPNKSEATEVPTPTTQPEPSEPAKSVKFDYEREEIPFLKKRNYTFTTEDEEAEFYSKSIASTTQIATPFGVINVAIGQIAVFVRKNKGFGTYQFGMAANGNAECSPPFAEAQFREKLETFENALLANAPAPPAA